MALVSELRCSIQSMVLMAPSGSVTGTCLIVTIQTIIIPLALNQERHSLSPHIFSSHISPNPSSSYLFFSYSRFTRYGSQHLFNL